ncbi:MAG: Hsp20/alpha crystallin family protein [Phycisphaerales bacterium]
MSTTCSPSCCSTIEESRGVSNAEPVAQRQPRPTRFFHPQVDAYLAPSGDHAVVVLDMPGCRRDGIDVTFDRGVLTIRGQAESRRPAGAEAMLLEEYAVGDYYRAFRVDFPVDAPNITAEYALGVLTVRVPKHEAARQRRVPVSIG